MVRKASKAPTTIPSTSSPPSPNADAFRCRQIDLFQTFLCNTKDEKERLSNALDLWDCIPRYSVSRQEMNKRRNSDGILPILNIPFEYKGQRYIAKIQPAMIEDGDGFIHYYPSANEELVEDALRKISALQNQGFFDGERDKSSGVTFSLYGLREELAARKHTRSYQEIVLSLEIMRKSHIEIRSGEGRGESLVAANYLPAMAAVSKSKLAEDPYARWIAQFHPLVTRCIDHVAYRQYNYAVMMSLPTQLARWLHKQLAVKFTFAGMMANPFEMRYSTIKRDSALLNRGRERDNIRDVEEAMRQLAHSGVLRDVQKELITAERGRISEVIYRLYPTAEFVREVKAANKRLQTANNKTSGESKELPRH